MTFHDPKLIVKTLVMLPSERMGLPQPEIDAETQYIIDNIVNQPNSEIILNPEVMKKISELGGDLIITVFACNFYINGEINQDVTEANFLNRRMFERFSVTKREDDPYTTKLIVGSTSLEAEMHGVALQSFKERLGLTTAGDLTVMTLVPMSPFPTAHNFVNSFADTFKEAALEEIEECYTRIVASPAHHTFVMQGTEQLFLSYIAVFNIGSYRQQVILTAKLPDDVMQTYVTLVEENPASLVTLTTEKALLSTILSDGFCEVTIYAGLNTEGLPVQRLAQNCQLTDIEVIINRSIAPGYLDNAYPEFMPFYLYGTTSQQHIDHMLLHAPNVQLSAAQVTLALDTDISTLADGYLLSRLIVIANTIREDAMQPFNADHKPTFFTTGRVLPVTIYRDPNPATQPGPRLLQDLGLPVATGTLTLPPGRFIDYTVLNLEHGTALSSRHPKVDGLGVSHLFDKIDIPSVGDPYNITPLDIAAISHGAVVYSPADEYEHKISIRNGWKDEFNKEMGERNLKTI